MSKTTDKIVNQLLNKIAGLKKKENKETDFLKLTILSNKIDALEKQLVELTGCIRHINECIEHAKENKLDSVKIREFGFGDSKFYYGLTDDNMDYVQDSVVDHLKSEGYKVRAGSHEGSHFTDIYLEISW